MKIIGVRHTRPRTCLRRLSLCLAVAAGCGSAFGEVLSPYQMVDEMRKSLAFYPNATLKLTIEADAAWHNVPGGNAEANSGKVVDSWRVVSDEGRVGMERYRDSPAGKSRTRTVYVEDHRKIFDFDVAASPDAVVLGKLTIRYQTFRSPVWRTPMLDYLDRLFTVTGAFDGDSFYVTAAGEVTSIDGHPCHPISGEWNGRDFTLWLDPEYGYLPRQYIMQLIHGQEMGIRRRGGPGFQDRRMLPAPERHPTLDFPIKTEEHLGNVVLEQLDGRSYMARATLVRTQTYPEGVSYTEKLAIQTADFSLRAASDAAEFLSFEGLLRDGTPVEERQGGRMEPETINHSYLKNGQLVPADSTIGNYASRLWRDLNRLVTNFNMENLQRIDTKFLVGVCVVAALAINGGMAYASYRRKRPKAG